MSIEKRIVMADGKVLGRFVGLDGYAVHKAAIRECKRRCYHPGDVWIDDAEDSGRQGRPTHYGVDDAPVVALVARQS